MSNTKADAPTQEAAGGRKGDPLGSALQSTKAGDVADDAPDYIPKGFSKEDIKNMGGSLKIHIRLALEVDIRVTAKVKGDICLGIL